VFIDFTLAHKSSQILPTQFESISGGLKSKRISAYQTTSPAKCLIQFFVVVDIAGVASKIATTAFITVSATKQ
jgi:hypothetical protein